MPTERMIAYEGKEYLVTLAHPAADALPWLLGTDEFRDIVSSMSSVGFDPEKPIYRQCATGRIICGRRRELAAGVAGVKPLYRDVDWTDEEILAFVERDELHRRHLSSSEKAASAVELAALKPHGGDRRSRAAADQVATSPFDPAFEMRAKTRDTIAKDSGVGVRTVRAAAAVREKSAQLFVAIKEGEIGAELAERLTRKATSTQIAAVVLADDVAKAAREVLAAMQPKLAPPPAPTPPTGDTVECPHCKGSGYLPKAVKSLRLEAGMPAVPDVLNRPEFLDAWELWLAERKARRKKVSPVAARLQLSKLAAVGVAAAITALNESIAHGWQGLFPEKTHGHGNGNGKTGGRPWSAHNPSRVTAAPGDFAGCNEPDVVVE